MVNFVVYRHNDEAHHLLISWSFGLPRSHFRLWHRQTLFLSSISFIPSMEFVLVGVSLVALRFAFTIERCKGYLFLGSPGFGFQVSVMEMYQHWIRHSMNSRWGVLIQWRKRGRYDFTIGYDVWCFPHVQKWHTSSYKTKIPLARRFGSLRRSSLRTNRTFTI